MSKSGQKRKRHLRKMRLKRRIKRKKATLIASGKLKKGAAPAPKSPAA
jgi:hypothetical protein